MKLKKLSFLILSVTGIAYSSAGIAGTALSTTVTPEPIPEFKFSDESLRIEQIKNSGNYTNADSDALKAVETNKGITIKGSKFLTDIDMAYPSSVKPTVNLTDDTHLIGTTLDHATFRLGDSFRGTEFDDSSVINITLRGIDKNNTGNLQLHNGTKSYNTTVDAWGVMELRTASDKEKVQAYNTLVKTNGKLTVSYNAYAENNLIDGGELYIPVTSNDAIVKNTIIRNGGTYTIDAGTAIDNYITGAGSYQAVSGLALNNYIYDGGYQTVYVNDKTGAKNTTIYQGGTQRVRSGTVEDTLVYGDQIISNHDGDWKNGQWVANNDPDETWGNDPTAKNTQIIAGGTQTVGLNGKAKNTTIYKDGVQSVENKGVATQTTIMNGGLQSVKQNGKASDTTVNSGGVQSVEDKGSVTNTTVMTNGAQFIAQYARTVSTIIDGGLQHVQAYGSTENTTIKNGGRSTLDDGAYSLGKLTVENGSLILGAGSDHTLNGVLSKGAYAEEVNLDSDKSFIYISQNAASPESIATINKLTNNGVTVFSDMTGNNTNHYSQLNINELSGNGLFVMNTGLADGKGDFLNITGSVSGHHGVRVMDSGKALVSNTSDPYRYHLIHAAGSQNDTFALTNKSVDLGAYKYYLVQDKDTADEWYLSPVKEITDPAKTALMIANAIPTVWKGELSTLRARLGELRNDPQVNLGVWSKATTARHNINNNEVAYRHDMNGIVAGGDKMTEFESGKLWTGVLAGHSHSSLDMAKNDGKIDSYSLGVYSTFRHNSGIYVDAVVKANHFRSTYDARFNDGKTSADSNTNGIGFSVEAGKYFEKDDYFIEPYAMVSAFRGQGADYRYTNGMSIKADAAKSFSGELGATFGKNFTLENGAQIKPYIRVAANHEFAKNGEVELNKETKRTNDMSGTTGKYGIGIDAKLNDKWAVYGEFNYAKSSKQETPYSGLIGVNYRF